jgi:hypothetical protein
MKRLILIVVLLVLCPALFAGSSQEEGKNGEAFDKLKLLAGTWNGTSNDGKPVKITYRVVSGGSAVMETMDHNEDDGGMVTMYHPDGDNLMMTHYCSMGNQPRMKASAVSSDGKLSFMCVGGSNMSEDDAHMHALAITFKDNDTISQNWTMRSEGKDEMHVIMDLKRTKD